MCRFVIRHSVDLAEFEVVSARWLERSIGEHKTSIRLSGQKRPFFGLSPPTITDTKSGLIIRSCRDRDGESADNHQ